MHNAYTRVIFESLRHESLPVSLFYMGDTRAGVIRDNPLGVQVYAEIGKGEDFYSRSYILPISAADSWQDMNIALVCIHSLLAQVMLDAGYGDRVEAYEDMSLVEAISLVIVGLLDAPGDRFFCMGGLGGEFLRSSHGATLSLSKGGRTVVDEVVSRPYSRGFAENALNNLLWVENMVSALLCY